MNKPASRYRAIAAIASLSAALALTGCSTDTDVPPPVAAESSAAATTSPSYQPVPSSSVSGTLSTAVAAPELFVGTWQDTTDPRSHMSFTADGTLSTSYEGTDATKSGTWELISTAEVPDIADAAAQSTEPALHTQLTFDGQQPLDQYFGIGELTTDTIRLIHLPRGNTLTYTRLH
ncbi:hypothetical protein [Rhodococcus sp. APC 3903]|uniref:hypothetical protein n=1 Tax=Rhodococcus sp. APC 3903 TaxID=3035193 RepID=UPI0025B5113D|nr:hypothetical protein [Rhodococcus sp. APC 3903]MDN3460879.1 hypothetical protein [Rhodococcus sp. APC 3903]